MRVLPDESESEFVSLHERVFPAPAPALHAEENSTLRSVVDFFFPPPLFFAGLSPFIFAGFFSEAAGVDLL